MNPNKDRARTALSFFLWIYVLPNTRFNIIGGLKRIYKAQHPYTEKITQNQTFVCWYFGMVLWIFHIRGWQI